MGLIVPGSQRWGNHGGLSWRVQRIPLVLSGPGIRHGVSGFPAKLVDVAPTIERLLGLPIPSGVDGVVLADALKAPSAAERDAQQAVRDGRMQDVQALRAHSLAQVPDPREVIRSRRES
jgi:arylsulfatase A-like enzyme